MSAGSEPVLDSPVLIISWKVGLILSFVQNRKSRLQEVGPLASQSEDCGSEEPSGTKPALFFLSLSPILRDSLFSGLPGIDVL